MIQPMHAHYLTVSESRRWSMDNPVGDPYGGPAFGEHKMPVIPVVVMAIGAYGVATAVTAIGYIAAGLTFLSGAFSLAGQLTGNRTLSQIGMVCGVAGAAVGFAGAVGNFVSGLDAAGGAADADLINSAVAESAKDSTLAGTSTAGDAASNLTVGVDSSGNLALQDPGVSSVSQAAPVTDTLANTSGSVSSDAGTLSNLTSLNTAANGTQPSLSSTLGITADGSSPAIASNIGDNGLISVGPNGPASGSVGAPSQVGLGSTVDAANSASGTGSGSVNMSVNGNMPADVMDSGSTTSKTTYGQLDNGPNPGQGQGGYKGDPNPDFWSNAKAAGKGVIDFANTNAGAKAMDLAGNVYKAYSENDMRDAQQAYLEAKGRNDDAAAQYYLEKINEMKIKRANVNARATNAAAQTGAVNQNANIYANPAKPASGGMTFQGA